MHPSTGEIHGQEEAVEMVMAALSDVGEIFANFYRCYEEAVLKEFRAEVEEYEERRN